MRMRETWVAGNRSLIVVTLLLAAVAGWAGCTSPRVIDDRDIRGDRLDASSDPSSDAEPREDTARDSTSDAADSADVPVEPGEPECGNGKVEGDEDCDDENDTDGDGCNNDCTFSCTSAADCDDGDPCNGAETCDEKSGCQPAAKAGKDGTECTLTVGGQGGGADGGPDGGDGGGGGTMMVPGRCVEGTCRASCKEAADCADGDACNGAEICDPKFDTCAAGTPPDCDDKLDCTADSCDPKVGCVNELMDGDNDGFAAVGLACDARGGDCDDGDDEVYPDAPELCDGKDNNCIDGIDETAPTWYQDCDGDGYARSGATSMTQCNKPATTAECLDWTNRTPVGIANIDCDDSYDEVNPGITAFASRPYCTGTGRQASGTAPSFSCAGIGGTVSWDYNCNGQQDRSVTATGNAECLVGGPPFFGCIEHWVDTAPACGFSGTLVLCEVGVPPNGCCEGIQCTPTRQQRCR